MTIKSLSLITATLLLTTNIHAEEDIGEITVISANKTSQSISETTSDITVITADDIEEKGYQTVAQALEKQSGIIISRWRNRTTYFCIYERYELEVKHSY